MADRLGHNDEMILDKITALHQLNDEQHKSLLKELIEVKDQTTRTNGRVRALENWKSMIVGAIAILNLVLWPIIYFMISHLVENSAK
jgi:hypothetical protein